MHSLLLACRYHRTLGYTWRLAFHKAGLTAAPIDIVLQAVIAITGIVGIFLLALPITSTLRPWGFWVLLASEPFWFAASIRARQWGVFVNAVFYTGALIYGALNNPLS